MEHLHVILGQLRLILPHHNLLAVGHSERNLSGMEYYHKGMLADNGNVSGIVCNSLLTKCISHHRKYEENLHRTVNSAKTDPMFVCSPATAAAVSQLSVRKLACLLPSRRSKQREE